MRASKKSGEAIIKYAKNKDNEFKFKILKANNDPKKVLPESPIKIFAGYQFQIKNPMSAPHKGINS